MLGGSLVQGKETENGTPRDTTKRRSATGASLRTRSAQVDLSGVPSLNLGSKPQARSSSAQIEHGTRHVGIAVEVLADSVSMREADDLGDGVRIDQIVEEDATGHDSSRHLAADRAYTREHHFVRREV